MEQAPGKTWTDGAGLRARMRADLTSAMRRRDRVAVAALRTALAALENAEAVPTADHRPAVGGGPVAGSALGAGSTEAQRHELTTTEVVELLADQVAEHEVAAADREERGRLEDAAALRRQAALLRAYLPR